MISQILKMIWHKRGSNALMILEILLSFLVLFTVISYIIYNMDRFTQPLGFGTVDRWGIQLNQRAEQRDSTEWAQTMDLLKSSLEDLDMVEEVGFSNFVAPFEYNSWQSSTDRNGFEMSSLMASADIGFKKALDIKVLEGRWFDESDATATYPPIVVSRAFIDDYYPNTNMIDSIIIFSGIERKIVGIVENYKYTGQFEKLEHLIFFFLPHTDKDVQHVFLKLKPGVTTAYEENVNKMIESVLKNSSFVIEDLEIKRIRNGSGVWTQLVALSSIAMFLLINVALGLFGVLWYNINKRRSEIGLRRAIGAHTTDISLQFILEIVLLASVALVIGLFFAVQIPLLNVVPTDKTIFYRSMLYSTLIVLFIVTLCALYPSRQAALIHPSNALHED